MIEVKFLNKELGTYEDNRWLMLDCYGDVYDGDSPSLGNLKRWYEPHFFINDKRIGIENETKE